MSKKVTSSLLVPITDTDMNVILDAASVPRTAAEVIRDENGKVTAVNVNLPDTAADNAVNALNRNNGVAIATSTPVTDDYDTWDGTQASLDAWLADGFTHINNMGSLAENTGIYEMRKTGTGGSIQAKTTLQAYNKSLLFPNTMALEAKVATVVGQAQNTSLAQFGVGGYFGTRQVNGVVQAFPSSNSRADQALIYIDGGYILAQVELANSFSITQSNVYRLEVSQSTVDPDHMDISFLIDGSSVASGTFHASARSNNYISFGGNINHTGTSDIGFDVDYYKWLKLVNA